MATQHQGALAANSPAAMMMAAMNQGASLEQVEKMMDLQDRWERKEAEKAYNSAFAAFKAEAVRIVKGRKVTDGPLRGKEYAELHDVVDAVTPALSRHGLSTSWKLTRDEKDWLEVTCTLKHVGGHSETVSMGGPPDAGGAKNPLQARASTKSYLERYTLKAICGVAEGGDDTDGNTPAATVPLALITAAREAAMGGWASLSAHIKSLSPADREALEPESYALKKAAKAADQQGAKQ
ncbi:single-stranded DNA-binding protein [Acidovorax sp. Leaf160]|nr:single-stranded DNA-binding protein [Acidovorax sp. Leaf160]